MYSGESIREIITRAVREIQKHTRHRPSHSLFCYFEPLGSLTASDRSHCARSRLPLAPNWGMTMIGSEEIVDGACGGFGLSIDRLKWDKWE